MAKSSRLTKVAAAAAVLVGLLAASPTFGCSGDLDENGRVEAAEVVLAVQCALRNGGPGCPDPGVVPLLESVRQSVRGCRSSGEGDVGKEDAVSLFYVTCRQCSDCPALLGESVPSLADVLPDGVTTLDQRTETVEVACAACGCPVPGTPIHYVLVSPEDAERLLASGWQRQP